ncbi:TRAP transporter small permease [Oceanobacillus alkalisoli]|uniref:TRAP transporter small permease n=1 Tax=Oceanobacillus alkalisoli TaxID=2925113 RepID=UPI001EE4D858|nr:TRAP transporter small permease [Oceanobacillus alkalisoli]MCG5102562.1 TRAP transporter small permease [Oceanobacillus alkalisoli]
MKKINDIIDKFLYYFLGLLMFNMLVVISAQVVSRYLFASPFTWTEEMGRYTFVWLSFLGMGLAVKKGGHIALDLLLKGVTGKLEKILQTIVYVLVGIFGGIFTVGGIKLMQLGAGQSSPSLSLPMELVYVVLPISGILIMYYVIEKLIKEFKRREETV